MTEILKAHNRYFRNDDISHPSLKDTFNFLTKRNDESTVESVIHEELNFVAADGKILITFNGKEHEMTDWSFGRVCADLKTPKPYINRMIDTDLAIDCLRHDLGIKRTERRNKREVTGKDSGHMNALVRGNTIRAWTSSRYRRIWDSSVVHNVIEHTDNDVKPAGYVAGGGVENPERSGIYTSDRDLFMFLVNESDPIDVGEDKPLHKGIILWNSEVGNSTLGWTTFYYRYVCANHIVWGAQNIRNMSKKHVGSVEEMLKILPEHIESLCTKKDDDEQFQKVVQAAMNAASTSAKQHLKDTKSKVAFLRGKGLSKTDAEGSVAMSFIDADNTHSDPATLWGTVQGITRYSQTIPYMDERLKIDQVSEKLLKLATN